MLNKKEPSKALFAEMSDIFLKFNSQQYKIFYIALMKIITFYFRSKTTSRIIIYHLPIEMLGGRR
jgi:hypothetical protein